MRPLLLAAALVAGGTAWLHPGPAPVAPLAASGQAAPGQVGPAQEAPAAADDPQSAGQDSVLALLRRVSEGQVRLEARLDSLDARVPERGRGTLAEGPGGASDLLEGTRTRVRDFGQGVFWSILLIVLFNYLIRGLAWLLDELAERQPSRRLFYKRLAPLVRIILWIFAAYLVVRVIFRVDVQGILAAAAAIGVAVGFAAQDLLKNLFGGLILVFDQPFQVGDKISVAGTYGEVVSIGLRSTRLVTPDDNLVSVPNAQVVDQQVANANAGQLNCQVVTDLFLPGWVDEARAKRIAFEAAASSKYVFLNKPIVVLVKDVFDETFLTRIRVKAYVLDPRYEFLFQSDVTERARAGFRTAGLVTRTDGMRAWVALGQPPGPQASEERS